jgi:hypothetical protein
MEVVDGRVEVLTRLCWRRQPGRGGVASLSLMFTPWQLCRVDIGDEGRHQERWWCHQWVVSLAFMSGPRRRRRRPALAKVPNLRKGSSRPLTASPRRCRASSCSARWVQP